MLHITNGSSVQIGETGLRGEIIYWVDVLHDGPVPAGLSLDELSRVREKFLADFFGVPWTEAFASRNAAIANFRDHEEVVLWFEHDLYDQLHLIQILDWFSTRDRGSTRVSLLCGDKYLGTLTPGELKPMFETRHEVTAPEYETASAAWRAFRSPEPLGLASLLKSDTSALPFLRGAIQRHLEQFPDLRNGLSRTERQSLSAIESGLFGFQQLFQANLAQEDSIYLGDMSYRQYLRGLAQARNPLLNEDGTRYEMTALGRLILACKEDHVRVNGINRWLGGVHLCAGAPIWRWDPDRKAIAP